MTERVAAAAAWARRQHWINGRYLEVDAATGEVLSEHRTTKFLPDWRYYHPAPEQLESLQAARSLENLPETYPKGGDLRKVGELLGDIAYEQRGDRWYRASDGRRVYTWAEKNEAVRLYRDGATGRELSEKLGIPAATIRTWARRERMNDPNVWYKPRSEM